MRGTPPSLAVAAAVVVAAMATAATVLDELEGDTLSALYALIIGYLFGVPVPSRSER